MARLGGVVGLLPGLLAPKRGILWVVAVVAVADVLWMPLLSPLVVLERGWWLGEGAGLALALLPGELLRRWTEQQRRLPLRVLMQVACFGGFTFGVIGLTVRTMTNDALWPLPVRPAWLYQIILQLWLLLSLMALSTVHEFYQRGRGTPLPYDAPRHLVTSGLYRYVANPMQLLMLLTMLAFAWLTGSVGYLLATAVAFCFSAGIANWQEAQHLRGRHGGRYDEYRRQVTVWWPRWRPALQPRVRATLGYDGGCGVCQQVGGWFQRRAGVGLLVAPVQTLGRDDDAFDWMACRRITYVECTADGTVYVASGVSAILRGLEHIHLGWALFAAPLRLPGVVQVLGLVVDVSGGGPRRATAEALSSRPHPLAP